MNDDTPPPSAPPPTRGDTTRGALIKAAIQIFGLDGFDAASTRKIADAAGVNQALIGYHFRGKAGLYLAVFQDITDSIRERMGPLLAAVETELGSEELDARADTDMAERSLALLHKLTDAFVAMLTSEASTAWARLILREQQDPSEAFDVLYEGFMSSALHVVTRLIGRIRSVDASSSETSLVAITVFGQVLVFRAARAAIMRRMDWQQLGAAEIAAIQARVRRNVTAILMQESSR